MKEATGIQFRGQKEGGKECVKRVVCPEKTSLFIIETSRPRWGGFI